MKLTRVQSGSYETGDDDEYFVLGESYRFKCEISGNPEPDHVTWIACDESGNVCNDTKEFSKNVRNTKNTFIKNNQNNFKEAKTFLVLMY